MATVNPSLSLITLNENGLNSTIERQRLPECILKKKKKNKTQQNAAYERLTSDLRIHIG